MFIISICRFEVYKEKIKSPNFYPLYCTSPLPHPGVINGSCSVAVLP